MHSRIFAISIEANFTKEDFPKDYEILEKYMDPSIDWVSSDTQFEGDVKWLGIWLETNPILLKSGIYQVNTSVLRRKLEEVKKKRIEEIKELLNSKNPDMWLIAQAAWNRKGFFFYLKEEDLLFNEIALLEDVLNAKKNINKIYIYKSYDYHF